MAEGWCKFHRPLLSHSLWLGEPFTRGQAFVDLFANAGHRPSSIRVRGIKVDLERGQLGFSELTLAERWKWSRGKVRRFLRELENDQMLAIKQDNKTTIITILNYDKYQGEDFFCDTANETAGGTPNGHQTDTIKKGKNGKKEEKDNTPLTPRKRGDRVRGEVSYSESFEQFWAIYPKPVGKAYAFACWQKIPEKHKGVKVPAILEALQRQINERHFHNPQGEFFPPNPSTWINQARWDDVLKIPQAAGAPSVGIEELLRRQQEVQP